MWYPAVRGDRSLVSVIAHELAHSRTGNLVTNANAEHFWLNEGFTMYAERRITLLPARGTHVEHEISCFIDRAMHEIS